MAKYIVDPNLNSIPPGYDGVFTSLFDAEYNAVDGDIIDVVPGEYAERLITNRGHFFNALDKSNNAVIIKDDTQDYPLLFQGGKTAIVDGFSLKVKSDGSSRYFAYVYLDSANKTLKNLWMEGPVTSCGLFVREGAKGTSIEDCHLSVRNNYAGQIQDECTFKRCTFDYDVQGKDVLSIASSCKKLNLTGNTFKIYNGARSAVCMRGAETPAVFSAVGNTIESDTPIGYNLGVGTEGITANDGNYNNAVFTDNVIYSVLHFSPSATGVSTHSLFVGHNLNPKVRRNRVFGGGYGLVYKGTNQSDSSGDISFNIFSECVRSLRIKGISGAKVFHNFMYQTLSQLGQTVVVTDNGGVGAGSIQEFRNNIVCNLTGKYVMFFGHNGTLGAADYNVYISNLPPQANVFYNSGPVDWLGWCGLGYDSHSLYIHKINDSYDVYDATGTKLTSLDYAPIYPTGKIVNRPDNPLIDAGCWVPDINDGGQTDAWGKKVSGSPNIGPDQGAGTPSTGGAGMISFGTFNPVGGGLEF